MIRIRDLSLPPDGGPELLKELAAKALRLSPEEIVSIQLHRRSVDARKKDDVRIICTVDAAVRGSEAKILRAAHCSRAEPARDARWQLPAAPRTDERPVIIGFGPAGMFAALVLAKAGLRPIILERGLDAAARREAVRAFWQGGALDPACNVQFGEGGAGTFSDGKLNTGIKNCRIRWVLEQFAAAGAGAEILTDARPHIGTDVLFRVVQELRRTIVSLGGEVCFGTRMTALETSGGVLAAVCAERAGESIRIPCRRLILAVGHSARDTFEALYAGGVRMEPKPFSMGVRIEHLQAEIDTAQYGQFAGHPALGPADYRLNVHFPDGTSAYTFCMCPGGQVVAAASETGGIVTNGMSDHARGGVNANAALLVTLHPSDFPDSSALGGMYWQRQIEQKAFVLAGGTYRAPAQLAGDFLRGVPSASFGRVQPSYLPGVTPTDLHLLLPTRITSVLEAAIPTLGQKLRGFDAPDAVLTGPETRSSSPVRIVRGADYQSVCVHGLYPCGEGAGYAGGIMSAAVDGMLCAEALIAQLSG